LIDLAEVEVAEDAAELLVIEDLFEDRLVGVQAGHDCREELRPEDELEVVKRDVARLGRKLLVGDPALVTLLNALRCALVMN